MNDVPPGSPPGLLRTREDLAQLRLEDMRWVAACYLDPYAYDVASVFEMSRTADGATTAGTATSSPVTVPKAFGRDLGPTSAAVAAARAQTTAQNVIDKLIEYWEPVHTLELQIDNPHAWKPLVNWSTADRTLPAWFQHEQILISSYTAPSVRDPLDTRMPDRIRDELIYLVCLYGGEIVRIPDDPTGHSLKWELPGAGYSVTPSVWRLKPVTAATPVPMGKVINAVDRFGHR